MKTEKHKFLTRLLHWVSAALIFLLFISGWIMVGLDYYSAWYTTLPEWHITAGVILLLLWSIMIIRFFIPKNKLPPLQHTPLESRLAMAFKGIFYILVVVIAVCGYLFTTADGQAKEVLDLLKLPALSHFSATQIDTMGWLHENLSYILMIMVVLHALGAMKHHFIDKDDTLKRML